MKCLDAYFLLQSLQIEDLEEALLQEHQKLIGRGSWGEELYDRASEAENVQSFISSQRMQLYQTGLAGTHGVAYKWRHVLVNLLII